jgi:hypothetical protein
LPEKKFAAFTLVMVLGSSKPAARTTTVRLELRDAFVPLTATNLGVNAPSNLDIAAAI